MPWRSSKASPFASAHEMACAGEGSCGMCARAGHRPSRPAVRRIPPAASRRVRDVVRWKPPYVSWMMGRTSTPPAATRRGSRPS
eukprot:4694096-Prymnesium_polylepis.1